ncbi:ATP-binding protein [Microbispora triticiradicis]|nr:ATP-binding protein [Microbispora triticiradicis]
MSEEEVTSPAEVNVRPHGRILSVLGDIEFAQWQCLAELIDNAFDDFLAQDGVASAGGRPTVAVSLPGRNSDPKTAEVWIRDNGRGMSLETLTNAVRAGWTSNSRYGSLGLYGMGFNIATARLGRMTTIKTTRVGDPSWTVLTLDLVQLSRGDDYNVPVRFEPKDDIGEHGTQIIISKLKTEQWDTLSKQEARIRDQLGDVYSYLLRERDFVITVNGKKVQPRLPCVWDASRSVTRHGAEIPAIIPIERTLPPANACMDCGFWNREQVERCEECGGARLELRGRRIWGWIGVQRYLHKTDYGLDFLRNGRKILIRDKSLFRWIDPDGLDDPLPEYPIDSRQRRGRFVGEIHCDHVPVNYQKNAFEYDSSEWRAVVRHLRGDGPLGEKIAEQRGYPRNTSRLAILYTGYRREDPGLKYLVPGDGKQVLFDKALEWAKRFRDGDPDYQTDEIWYQAAYQHDHPVTPDPEPAPDDIFDDMGLGGDDLDFDEDSDTPAVEPSETEPESLPAPEETLDQRLARYRENATKIVDISGRYEASDLGSVDLTAWAVSEASLKDAAGNTVPLFAQMIRAPRVEIFIAAKHPLLTEYGMEMRDLAMVELSEFMRVRWSSTGRDPKPLSIVLSDIKTRVTDQKVTADVLGTRAGRLLDRIREAMQREIKGSPTGYWELLQESDRLLAQRRFAIEGGDATWDATVESGDFALFLPPSAIVRLLERRPEVFLDGKVFKRQFLGLSDDTSRSLIVSRLVGYVSDLALLLQHQGARFGLAELQRARLSCVLVETELADSE